jgi:hypothetical protein
LHNIDHLYNKGKATERWNGVALVKTEGDVGRTDLVPIQCPAF